MLTNESTKISIFPEKHVRKVFFENEWWFSVLDIIALFTYSKKPINYWQKIKEKEKNTFGVDLSELCKKLILIDADGKKYETDCANTEGIFRIIQSIHSSKAEPFKIWLAKVGKERIDEIENPELAIDRAKSLYEKKGYPKEWITKRLQSINIRQKLTDEWDNRGAQKSTDCEILTNDIMQGAFSLKVEEYKQIKGLEKENLRDHMSDLELIITMLGEATTTQITQQNNSTGLPELRTDAKVGGALAGRTRKDIEKQLGATVISKENFLAKKANPALSIERSTKLQSKKSNMKKEKEIQE